MWQLILRLDERIQLLVFFLRNKNYCGSTKISELSENEGRLYGKLLISFELGLSEYFCHGRRNHCQKFCDISSVGWRTNLEKIIERLKRLFHF